MHVFKAISNKSRLAFYKYILIPTIADTCITLQMSFGVIRMHGTSRLATGTDEQRLYLYEDIFIGKIAR